MDNNLNNQNYASHISVEPTYSKRIYFQHENTVFTAGLCLSKLSLKELQEKKNAFLHPKELLYLNTLHYSKRQYSYLLGRYCAKQAFISQSNFKCPTEILIENGILQQPIIYFPKQNGLIHCNLQVSISHTENLGAAIIFNEALPMAIDVEIVDKSKDDVILSQLTSNETKMAFNLINDCNFETSELYSEVSNIQIIWTMKEALSKVIKCGLTVPFELLEVKTIIQKENYLLSEFKNFYQYQSLSFVFDRNICSIVFPKIAKLHLDVTDLQNSMHKFEQNT